MAPLNFPGVGHGGFHQEKDLESTRRQLIEFSNTVVLTIRCDGDR